MTIVGQRAEKYLSRYTVKSGEDGITSVTSKEMQFKSQKEMV